MAFKVRSSNAALKNTCLGKLPFFDFAANQAWANIAALASNLVSWLQLTALPDGHHARDMGHQTLALPALRHHRENHHPRQTQAAAAPLKWHPREHSMPGP
jgi:hypothetical protein